MQGRARLMLGPSHWMQGRARLMQGRALLMSGPTRISGRALLMLVFARLPVMQGRVRLMAARACLLIGCAREMARLSRLMPDRALDAGLRALVARAVSVPALMESPAIFAALTRVHRRVLRSHRR